MRCVVITYWILNIHREKPFNQRCVLHILFSSIVIFILHPIHARKVKGRDITHNVGFNNKLLLTACNFSFYAQQSSIPLQIYCRQLYLNRQRSWKCFLNSCSFLLCDSYKGLVTPCITLQNSSKNPSSKFLVQFSKFGQSWAYES